MLGKHRPPLGERVKTSEPSSTLLRLFLNAVRRLNGRSPGGRTKKCSATETATSFIVFTSPFFFAHLHSSSLIVFFYSIVSLDVLARPFAPAAQLIWIVRGVGSGRCLAARSSSRRNGCLRCSFGADSFGSDDADSVADGFAVAAAAAAAAAAATDADLAAAHFAAC